MLALFLISCENKAKEVSDNKSDLTAIDLQDISKIEAVQGFNLSDVSSEIDVVPLETTEESLFSSIDDIIVSDSNIFIEDVRNGVLRFDRNGKFMNKIGKKGEGPEEYIMLKQIEYDELNKEIFLFTESGIKSYDLEGKFKRHISSRRNSQFYGGRNGRCYLFNNHFLLNASLPLVDKESDSLWTFSIYDMDMNSQVEFYNYDIIENLEYIKNNKSPMSGWKNYCSEGLANVDLYGDNMKIIYYAKDTIFEIDKETLNLKPIVVLSMGERPDFKTSHEWIKSDEFFKYLWRDDFFESDKYYYFLLSKSSHKYIVRYDKGNGDMHVSKSESKIKETSLPGSPGFVYKRRNDKFTFNNDILSNHTFEMGFRSKGKYIIDVIFPSGVDSEYIQNVKEGSVKDENSKDRFVKVLSNLKEDDNPILLIATLK